MRGKTRRPSGTGAIPRLTISLVRRPWIGSPRKLIVPSLGRTSPSTVFMVVDLPEALPPSSETISPSRISQLTPFSTWSAP